MRIATNSGKIDISKEDKTFNLAKFFANFITEGDVIFLYGEILSHHRSDFWLISTHIFTN